MPNVGYLEGTDPLVLIKLAARGIDTTPLSNGFDNHGKYVNHVTREDGISAVIGYLHKIMPTPDVTLTPRDLLFACLTHEIPVLTPSGPLRWRRLSKRRPGRPMSST